MTKPVYIFYGITPRTDGVLAQLVEHHNGIVGVKGSNPLGSTILKESVIFSGVMATIIRLVFLAGLLLAAGRVFPQSPASGPLWLHPGNPRYFADGNGKAVYLTGSHTWNNLPDIGTNRPPAAFDFDACLRLLTAHHHNPTYAGCAKTLGGNVGKHKKPTPAQARILAKGLLFLKSNGKCADVLSEITVSSWPLLQKIATPSTFR